MKEIKIITHMADTQDDIQGSMSARNSCLETDKRQFSSDKNSDVTGNTQQQASSSCNLTPGQKLVQYFTHQTNNMNSSPYPSITPAGGCISRQDSSSHASGSPGSNNISDMMIDEQHHQQQSSFNSQNPSNTQQQQQLQQTQTLYGESENRQFSREESSAQQDHYDSTKLDGLSEHLEGSGLGDHFGTVVASTGHSEHVDQSLYVQVGSGQQGQCTGSEQQHNQPSSIYEHSQQQSPFKLPTQQGQCHQPEGFQASQEQQQQQQQQQHPVQFQQYHIDQFQQPQAPNTQQPQETFQIETRSPQFHQTPGSYQGHNQDGNFVQKVEAPQQTTSLLSPQSMPILQHGLADQSGLHQGQQQQQQQQQLHQLQHNRPQLQPTGVLHQSMGQQSALDTRAQQQQSGGFPQQQFPHSIPQQQDQQAHLQIAALQQQIAALQQQIQAQQNPAPQQIQAQLDEMRQQILALKNPVQHQIPAQPSPMSQHVQSPPNPVPPPMQIQHGSIHHHTQGTQDSSQNPVHHQIQTQPNSIQIQTQPSPIPHHPQSPMQSQIQVQPSPMPAPPLQNQLQPQTTTIQHQIQAQQSPMVQQSPMSLQTPMPQSPVQQQMQPTPSALSQQMQASPGQIQQPATPQSPIQQTLQTHNVFTQHQIQGGVAAVNLPVQNQPNQLQHQGQTHQSSMLTQGQEPPSPIQQRIQTQESPLQHYQPEQSHVFRQSSNPDLQQELVPKQQNILQAFLDQHQAQDENSMAQHSQQQNTVQQQQVHSQAGLQQQLQQEQSLLIQLQQQKQQPLQQQMESSPQQANVSQGLALNQFQAGLNVLQQQQQQQQLHQQPQSQLHLPHQNLLQQQQQQQQQQPMQLGRGDQNENFLIASTAQPFQVPQQQQPVAGQSNLSTQPVWNQASLTNTAPSQSGGLQTVMTAQEQTALLQAHQDVVQSLTSQLLPVQQQQQMFSQPSADQQLQNNSVFDSVMASQILQQQQLQQQKQQQQQQQQQLQTQTSRDHEDDGGQGFVSLATKELVQLLAETSTQSQQQYHYDHQQQQHVSSLSQIISQPTPLVSGGVLSQRGPTATGVAFLQQVLRENADIPAVKSESSSQMDTFDANDTVSSHGSPESGTASKTHTSPALVSCSDTVTYGSQQASVPANRKSELKSILQGQSEDEQLSMPVRDNTVFVSSSTNVPLAGSSSLEEVSQSFEAKRATTASEIIAPATTATITQTATAPSELLKVLINDKTQSMPSTVESFSKPQTDMARHLDDDMFLSPTHSDSDQELDSADMSTPIASMSEDTQMALVQRSNDLVLDDETIFSTLDEGKYFGGLFDNNYSKPRKVAKSHRHDTPSSRPNDCVSQKPAGIDKVFDVKGASVIFNKFGKDVPGVFTFTGNSTTTSTVLKTRSSPKPVILPKGLKREANGSCLGKSRSWKDPSLSQAFVSKVGEYELKVLTQPEKQHRARYMTEGSRGAIKDESQQGNPMVQLLGYKQPCTLQIFIGTDTGKVRPHGFYQVCKVSGKSSTPCRERDVDGTTVIEIDMSPETDMKVNIDCVGILKLRNADVEQRIGVARSKKKSTKTRMVFRVNVQKPDGTPCTLQTTSTPILCTQPAGQPEVCKRSVMECPPEGDVEMIIIGKNFTRNVKAVFTELNEEGEVIWEKLGTVDPEFFQPTHLVITIPPYRDPDITDPVMVQFHIQSSGKTSDPQPLTYKPAGKTERDVENMQTETSVQSSHLKCVAPGGGSEATLSSIPSARSQPYQGLVQHLATSNNINHPKDNKTPTSIVPPNNGRSIPIVTPGEVREGPTVPPEDGRTISIVPPENGRTISIVPPNNARTTAIVPPGDARNVSSLPSDDVRNISHMAMDSGRTLPTMPSSSGRSITTMPPVNGVTMLVDSGSSLKALMITGVSGPPAAPTMSVQSGQNGEAPAARDPTAASPDNNGLPPQWGQLQSWLSGIGVTINNNNNNNNNSSSSSNSNSNSIDTAEKLVHLLLHQQQQQLQLLQQQQQLHPQQHHHFGSN